MLNNYLAKNVVSIACLQSDPSSARVYAVAELTNFQSPGMRQAKDTSRKSIYKHKYHIFR